MFGGSKVIVGLDMGSYAIKAVAIQASKGRVSLQGYAHQRIGEQDPAVVARQVVAQLGVKPRDLVTGVSGRSVIVRQVPTKKQTQAELRNHMLLEADRYIPFETSEVVLDCQALNDQSPDDEEMMDVILVAVRRGFIEDQISLLQSAGLTPRVIDVDVFALLNCYLTLGPEIAAAPAGEEGEGASAPPQPVTALLDIGNQKSWIAIIQGDRLMFQREIYLAGGEVTEALQRTFNDSPDNIEMLKLDPGDNLDAVIDAALPALEDLANEVRLSFDHFEGQFDMDVSRVILTGGSCLLPGMAEELSNILSRPVQAFDPLSGVDLIPSRYDLHSLDTNAPALAIALGLACHEVDAEIRGLGGPEPAMWQPRRSSSRPSRSDGAPEPAAAMAPAAAAAGGLAPPPQPAIDMPGDSGMNLAPPPPPADPGALAYPDAGPAPAVDVTPAHGVAMPSDESSYGGSKSSMLVVLEDDDDMGAAPPSYDLDDEGDLPPLPG